MATSYDLSKVKDVLDKRAEDRTDSLHGILGEAIEAITDLFNSRGKHERDTLHDVLVQLDVINGELRNVTRNEDIPTTPPTDDATGDRSGVTPIGERYIKVFDEDGTLVETINRDRPDSEDKIETYMGNGYAPAIENGLVVELKKPKMLTTGDTNTDLTTPLDVKEVTRRGVVKPTSKKITLKEYDDNPQWARNLQKHTDATGKVDYFLQTGRIKWS